MFSNRVSEQDNAVFCPEQSRTLQQLRSGFAGKRRSLVLTSLQGNCSVPEFQKHQPAQQGNTYAQERSDQEILREF